MTRKEAVSLYMTTKGDFADAIIAADRNARLECAEIARAHPTIGGSLIAAKIRATLEKNHAE